MYTHEQEIAFAIRDAYEAAPTEVRRIPTGQGTRNYRVGTHDGRPLFVKRYPADADLVAERAAIAASGTAGDAGVPVARARHTRDGDVLASVGDVTLSVWEWVDGTAITTGLRRPQLYAAGAALGRIHRRFAALPGSDGPAPRTTRFLAFDLERNLRHIDRLRTAIAARPAPDPFDTRADSELCERRVTVLRVPALIASLPPLSSQFVHGDYSVVNLLFDGDRLSAVTDFRPPNPYLVAFELGRIAFDCRTIVFGSDWVGDAMSVVDGYLRTRGEAQDADVESCGRVALIHLLASLYGVEDHYESPGLLQDDLDEYWALRHRASGLLLDRIAEVDRALAEAVSRGGGHRR